MNRLSKALLIAGIAGATVLATPKCSSDPISPEKTALMGIKSMQCIDTPWEKESVDVKTYYARKGIGILGVKAKDSHPTCAACYVCERGYTLVAEIPEKDTLALMNDGFTHYRPGKH